MSDKVSFIYSEARASHNVTRVICVQAAHPASCFSDLLPLSSVSVSTVAGVLPSPSLYLDLLLFHPKIECDRKAAIYRLLPPVD